MSDRARSAGADPEGGGADVAADSPAKKAIVDYFTGRANRNMNPGGARRASAGGESGRDERSDDGRNGRSANVTPNTKAVKALMRVALAEGERIANLATGRDASAAAS